MQPDSIRIGSWPYWLGLRLFQLVWTGLAIWMLLLPADKVQPHKTSGTNLFFLAGLLFLTYCMHGIVWGELRPDGIWLVRYVRPEFVPWSKVERVDWWVKSGVIRVCLREPQLGSRLLQFNHPYRSIFQMFKAVRSHFVPEEVRFIESHIHQSPET